jgi:hypothetical protein
MSVARYVEGGDICGNTRVSHQDFEPVLEVRNPVIAESGSRIYQAIFRCAAGEHVVAGAALSESTPGRR